MGSGQQDLLQHKYTLLNHKIRPHILRGDMMPRQDFNFFRNQAGNSFADWQRSQNIRLPGGGTLHPKGNPDSTFGSDAARYRAANAGQGAPTDLRHDPTGLAFFYKYGYRMPDSFRPLVNQMRTKMKDYVTSEFNSGRNPFKDTTRGSGRTMRRRRSRSRG